MAAILDQVKDHIDAGFADVKAHITQEADRIMSNTEDILNRHNEEIEQQLTQTREALEAQSKAFVDMQKALDDLQVSQQEKAALQAALDAAIQERDTLAAGVEAGTGRLASDDPQEPGDTEPPAEPTAQEQARR